MTASCLQTPPSPALIVCSQWRNVRRRTEVPANCKPTTPLRRVAQCASVGGGQGGGGCRGMAPVQRYGTKEAAGFALAQSVAFDPPTHPPGWGKTAHPPPTRFQNSVQPCLKGFFHKSKIDLCFPRSSLPPDFLHVDVWPGPTGRNCFKHIHVWVRFLREHFLRSKKYACWDLHTVYDTYSIH